MARRSKRRSARRRFSSIRRRFGGHRAGKPALAPLLGTGIALAQPVLYGLNTGGDAKTIATNIANGFSVNFMAYDFVNRKFTTSGLVNAYVPLIGGVAAHKVANWTGINRYIRRFGFTI